MNPTRPQSSMLLNVNDPIQIHLLVETALSDSKEFEILSPEEVDDLKKQCQSLSARIEQTRQNLAIQSKYRDAAISMSKLYSDKSQDGKKPRRSLLGHNRQSSDQVREAEQERISSERKCEELAVELFDLEKRIMGPQSRLLKHTAGILQMTHKGPKKPGKGQSTQQNGIPGSPESMFTYSNARNSIEPISDELFFDDRSLYREAGLDFGGDIRSEALGMPSKARMQMITKTEQKLEDLNNRLRQIIVKANPTRDQTFGMPPGSKKNGSDSGDNLQNHLDYLTHGIDTIDQEHSQLQRKQQESDAAMEETLEDLNREVRGLLLPFDANRPEPPQPAGNGFNEQLLYFQDTMGAFEMQLARGGGTPKGNVNQDSLDQMETVLMGLWDIIKSGEEEERSRKIQRKQTRAAQNLPPDEDDSPDEDNDPNEPFTLQAFSAKVQYLYSEATRLKDQKKVLQRQIKQQRELNSKSDATKDAEMVQKDEELSRINALLVRTEADSTNVREQLSEMMDQLDDARQKENLRDQARGQDESARAELEIRNKKIADLEDQLQDMEDDRAIGNAELQGKLSGTEAKMAALMAELATIAGAAALVKEKEKEIEKKEQEMEEANMEIARLQTEVTIARAELDGAYGSRAQRAAEVAANPAIQKEIDDLTKRNAALTTEVAALKAGGGGGEGSEKMKTLKKELEETIEEYEQMTKASIEWEKERENLEGTIDKLRDERERLEAELSDEKVRWLGMKSPGLDGSAPGSTSTTVLKNEFKKMMRDTRAENAKALRV